MSEIVALRTDQTSNGGEEAISFSRPYTVSATISGVVPILFHRWDCEAVEEKAKAAKGSKAKKSDNIESYLWRNSEGEICLPGEYVRQSIIWASKFKQDPRSPRKSAMDLFKAGIISLTDLASLHVKAPDFLDHRRVSIQRQSITRTRPAMKPGWHASFEIMVNLPEYIAPIFLHEVLNDAGRLIGVGDFRPTYGRFAVDQWLIM